MCVCAIRVVCVCVCVCAIRVVCVCVCIHVCVCVWIYETCIWLIMVLMRLSVWHYTFLFQGERKSWLCCDCLDQFVLRLSWSGSRTEWASPHLRSTISWVTRLRVRSQRGNRPIRSWLVCWKTCAGWSTTFTVRTLLINTLSPRHWFLFISSCRSVYLFQYSNSSNLEV